MSEDAHEVPERNPNTPPLSPELRAAFEAYAEMCSNTVKDLLWKDRPPVVIGPCSFPRVELREAKPYPWWANPPDPNMPRPTHQELHAHLEQARAEASLSPTAELRRDFGTVFPLSPEAVAILSRYDLNPVTPAKVATQTRPTYE